MSETENTALTPAEAAAMIDDAMTGEQPIADKPAVEPEPAAAEPAVEPEQAPAAPQAYAPTYAPTLPDGSAERYAAIAEELKALGQQYDEGELESAEYHAKSLALHDERTAIAVQRALAQDHAQQVQHQAAQSWASAQTAFFAQEGNRRFQDNPILFQAMNTAVQVVGADPAISAKGYAAILDAARASVEQAFSPAPVVDGKPAPRVTAKPAQAPYSLSDIPGGTAPPTDPFAAIDGKSPLDMVDAIMDMPPEKREAWLNRRI